MSPVRLSAAIRHRPFGKRRMSLREETNVPSGRDERPLTKRRSPDGCGRPPSPTSGTAPHTTTERVLPIRSTADFRLCSSPFPPLTFCPCNLSTSNFNRLPPSALSRKTFCTGRWPISPNALPSTAACLPSTASTRLRCAPSTTSRACPSPRRSTSNASTTTSSAATAPTSSTTSPLPAPRASRSPLPAPMPTWSGSPSTRPSPLPWQAWGGRVSSSS